MADLASSETEEASGIAVSTCGKSLVPIKFGIKTLACTLSTAAAGHLKKLMKSGAGPLTLCTELDSSSDDKMQSADPFGVVKKNHGD